jgi:hypothetical protein
MTEAPKHTRRWFQLLAIAGAGILFLWWAASNLYAVMGIAMTMIMVVLIVGVLVAGRSVGSAILRRTATKPHDER